MQRTLLHEGYADEIRETLNPWGVDRDGWMDGYQGAESNRIIDSRFD